MGWFSTKSAGVLQVEPGMKNASQDPHITSEKERSKGEGFPYKEMLAPAAAARNASVMKHTVHDVSQATHSSVAL